MIPAMIPFDFQGQRITVIERDGAHWFVAGEVCRQLDIKNSRDAVTRLGDDEKGVVIADTPGGPQKVTVISESGLYALIFTSRLPSAHEFRRWVTSVVIPAIRRTGRYGVPVDPLAALEDPAALRALLGRYAEKTQALAARVEVAEAGLKRIADAGGSLTVTDAAKTLGMPPRALFDWLFRHRWIYRRSEHGSWVAFSDKLNRGLLEHKIATVTSADGDRSYPQLRVTTAGLAKLAELTTNLERA